MKKGAFRRKSRKFNKKIKIFLLRKPLKDVILSKSWSYLRIAPGDEHSGEVGGNDHRTDQNAQEASKEGEIAAIGDKVLQLLTQRN